MKIPTTVCAILVGTGPAFAGDLPGTMNFENQTADRVTQVQDEFDGDNIKEVTHGDIDNDGDLDVVIGAAGGVFGNRQNKLYRNDAGDFQEITADVVPGFLVFDLTRHTFIIDFDLDGWNDILVANDELGGGGPFKLYMNQHPGDVFDEFVEEGAARGLTFEAACGAEAEDWDGDGDIDIYSGNYPGPSQDRLYRNNGSGTFSIITGTHLPVDSDYTIDVNSADFNGDGKLDLLVSNENDPYYAYYNDKLDEADQGVGDFRYGTNGVGGKQTFGTSGDGSMEAGDFNGDGMTDFYWTNKVGSNGDRIMLNTGNNASGMAQFVELMPPPYGTTSFGRKGAVADLNADGRLDIVVGTDGRPGVFRNTTVNGQTSFVDWTPGDEFPSGSAFRASHAGLFDTNGDGDIDIFVGAFHDDYVFENVPSVEVDEDDLIGGVLPAIYNNDPVAVLGHGTGTGSSDTYTAMGIGSTSFISAVVNGPEDYRLEVLDAADNVLASSDRGGLGVEEALQVNTNSGTYKLRVTVVEGLGLEGDADLDGDVDVDDLLIVLASYGGMGGAGDVNGDGSVNVDDVLLVLANWGQMASNDYVLEALSRSRN